jgi:hypothetical protein
VDVIEVIENVEGSDEFLKFMKENPDDYLVHVFSMMDSLVSNEWQLGYYGKKTDKITVFEYTEDGPLKMTAAEEAFKKENYIQPLIIDKIKVSRESAIRIVDKILKENYHAELLSKMIMLLQVLPEFGQIWNITIVTATFNVINVKIDSEKGDVIKHSKESLIGWKRE